MKHLSSSGGQSADPSAQYRRGDWATVKDGGKRALITEVIADEVIAQVDAGFDVSFQPSELEPPTPHEAAVQATARANAVLDAAGLPPVQGIADIPELAAVTDLTGTDLADLFRPVRERCAPWCDARELHAADPGRDDGGCMSADYSTALNYEWHARVPVVADVVANRDADHEHDHLLFVLRSTGSYDATSVRMSPAEARRIARHLVIVADLVEAVER